MPGTPTSIADLLHQGQPLFSFEFFPPRTDEGERTLWAAIRELESLSPSFVSVTYGAGGSTRERTIAVTERIAADTTLLPLGHLTCVGASVDELRRVVGAYAGAGVMNVLALRGDPIAGAGAPWVTHPGGCDHASELVELVRSLGDFTVGVAAFPHGHPESASLDHDADWLVHKAQRGASFAVTQFFFEADVYFGLRDRVAARGCDLPILPGLMPITDLRQVERMATLAGQSVPSAVLDAFRGHEDDPDAVRAIGIDLASGLARELLDGGAPGLHFYTLNRSTATREIYQRLELSARH
jgi:methylenetetrahydrofolate reductase (NADPH)